MPTLLSNVGIRPEATNMACPVKELEHHPNTMGPLVSSTKQQYKLREQAFRVFRRIRPGPLFSRTARVRESNDASTAFCLATPLARFIRVIVIVLCVGIASVVRLGNVPSISGKANPTGQLYFGLTYPQTPNLSALSNYETEIGKNVSLVLWYQSWIEQGQRQAFPTDDMDAVRLHGAIPVLAWEPDEYPSQPSEPEFSLNNIASGAWDDYIRQYADEAKVWGHPFFLRFASEMNGSWVPWSEWANGNSAGQFITMWRHVHDIFTAEGATNVTWIWCPNVDNGDAIPMKELYPGDAYVDWLGMDGYNFSSSLKIPWWSFAQVFQFTYNQLLALTPSSKPIIIGETGSVEAGGSKAQWITDALTMQLPTHFPRIKALIWFNMVDGDIDLRIQTSPQSLAAFRNAIASSTYQTNIYRSLSQSPIPPPEQIVVPQPAPLAALFAQVLRQSSSIFGWSGSLWGLTSLFVTLQIGFLLTLAFGVIVDGIHRRRLRRRTRLARE